MRQSVQSLRCDACGASEPLSRSAQRDGWYRCGFCETPHATPVSPFEVYEGPDTGVVLLSQKGWHEFILPAGRLCGTRALVASLFIVWNLGVGLTAIVQPDHALYDLGMWVVWGGVIVGTALLFRARLSTQHFVVRTRTMEVFRSLQGSRWGFKRFPIRAEGPSVSVVELPDSSWSATRHKVEVDVGEVGVVTVSCSGQREARWLAAMIGHGLAEGDKSDVSRCSGCGAPLGVGLDEWGEGRVDCLYCRAGFVVGAEGVRWGPVRMPVPNGAYDLPPHYVRVRSREGGMDFELLPGQAGARWFFASGLAANTLFWGGFAWVALGWLWPDAAANGVRPAYVAELVAAGVMFAFLSGFTAIAAANILWGTERVRLSEGSVEHAWLLRGRPVPRWLQLGGWKTYRRLLTDNEERKRVNIFEGFTHALSRRVALMRLSEVRFSRDDWGTVAELVSPARTLRLSWDLPDYSDQWLRDQLLEGMRARLGQLGRDVVDV